MKLRKQNLIVKLMESETITPLDGYRRLRNNFAAMIKTEQTTDYCQVVAELEAHNKVHFMDRFKN